MTSEERGILKQKEVIGLQSPRQLLNQVWLNNSMLFGIRGGTDSHNLKWGDIKLKQKHRLAGADGSSIFLLKVKGPISILQSQRREGWVERGV
ncbi:hypothetical protein DPMN_152518 [Dreissena polymorpha]|uniref:Uncharacterized protein n=1 Tax=Dreissena polymorpha TaxID=45954 RepID=A0A9D4FJP2_DREPO|nr:hypothetical protein DPMN_152518 [Dreissena polymorpha]